MNTRVKSIVLFIVCMVFSFNTKLFAWEDISKVVIDYENWVDISVTIRDQHYGPVVVSVRLKFLGLHLLMVLVQAKSVIFVMPLLKKEKLFKYTMVQVK